MYDVYTVVTLGRLEKSKAAARPAERSFSFIIIIIIFVLLPLLF